MNICIFKSPQDSEFGLCMHKLWVRRYSAFWMPQLDSRNCKIDSVLYFYYSKYSCIAAYLFTFHYFLLGYILLLDRYLIHLYFSTFQWNLWHTVNVHLYSLYEVQPQLNRHKCLFPILNGNEYTCKYTHIKG